MSIDSFIEFISKEERGGPGGPPSSVVVESVLLQYPSKLFPQSSPLEGTVHANDDKYQQGKSGNQKYFWHMRRYKVKLNELHGSP